MSKKLYFKTIAREVELTKIAMIKNFIQVERLWMKISKRDLNYIKKHYNVGDFITIDYKCYSGGYHYIITKVYKKISRIGRAEAEKNFNNCLMGKTKPPS